jgi:hypothetical protein
MFLILVNLFVMKELYTILVRISTPKYLNDETISTISFSKLTFGYGDATALCTNVIFVFFHIHRKQQIFRIFF